MQSTTITSFVPLNVVIIGCGIGGLAAAIALKQQGHYVTVYERSHFASEVGASITISANATKFLEQWGVDVVAARSVIVIVR
jgi:salicylate hydroxylase